MKYWVQQHACILYVRNSYNQEYIDATNITGVFACSIMLTHSEGLMCVEQKRQRQFDIAICVWTSGEGQKWLCCVVRMCVCVCAFMLLHNAQDCSA